MDIQQKQQICFTYSPNWYSQQSILWDHVNHHIIYYASNHLLYKYNRITNTVIQEISAKALLKEYSQKYRNQNLQLNDIQSKSLKIFAIALTLNGTIILGMNDGIILLLDRNLNCRSAQHIKCKNISHIIIIQKTQEHPDKQLQFVLFDQIGASIKLFFIDHKLIKLQLKIDSENQKKSKLKKYFLYQGKYLCFYQKGSIYIFDQNFDKAIRQLKYTKQQTILYLDFFEGQVIMLSKDKDQLILCYFKIQYDLSYPLQHTKTIYQITKILNKCKLDIEYPKKYYYRKQQLKKASLCVKWISKSKFIFSGKMGQLYLFDTNKKINIKNNKIILKPFSIDISQQQLVYECVADSKHYKDIYEMYNIDNGTGLMMIGVDRILSFWKIGENFQYDSLMKFLGSKVKKILHSQNQKNVAFLLMENDIIRSFQLKDQQQKLAKNLNQYWKIAEKYKIIVLAFHPTQEGVLAFYSDDNKVILYDLYQQRYIKIYQIDTLIPSNIKFLSVKQTQQIINLFDTNLITLPQSTVKQLYIKKIKTGYTLLVQFSNALQIIPLQNTQNPVFKCNKYFIDQQNTENIDDLLKYTYQQHVFAFMISQKGVRCRYINKTNKKGYINFVQKKYTPSLTAKLQNQTNQIPLLIVGLYHSKDIEIKICNINDVQGKIIHSINLTYTYNIEKLILNQNLNSILVYSLVNSTVQVWQFDKTFTQNILAFPKSKNIRGHYGNIVTADFLGDNHVISCSQDHNIKIWDLRKINQKQPQKPRKKKNKKKNKNKKNNNNKSEQIEIEQDDEQGNEGVQNNEQMIKEMQEQIDQKKQ